MLDRFSPNSITTDMCCEERSDIHVKEALAAELACLLGEYVQHHRTLTSWDCHCLRQAINLVEAGLYAQALERITQISRPPVPLPLVPASQPLTLADVCRALAPISREALTGLRILPGLGRLAREAQAGRLLGHRH
jgi:hypothetical protein